MKKTKVILVLILLMFISFVSAQKEMGRIDKIIRHSDFSDIIIDGKSSMDDSLIRTKMVDDNGTMEYERKFAIDPSAKLFTRGKLNMSPAKANALYKCANWDFNNSICNGEWIFLKRLEVGKPYSIDISPADPGFEEIFIYDVEHLDENRTFISNIFNETNLTDGWYSPAIYHGEFIRVYFESPLYAGNMINIITRNNLTKNISIKLYDEDSNVMILNTQRLLSNKQYDFVIPDDYIGSGYIFDMKIVSPQNDSSAYLEFDWIKDAITNFQKRIDIASDDADECDGDNVMFINEVDVELGRPCNLGNKIGGLLFNTVTIPNNATILDAYIEVISDRNDVTPTTMTVCGEDIDNSSTFTTSAGNITNRLKTTNCVNWITSSWTNGLAYNTSNLTNIVQEIINRPGWVENNSMTFIINGTIRKEIISYDANPLEAALLVITFEVIDDNVSPSVIGNLSSPSQTNESIFWDWINPSDIDFLENILFLNGTWLVNTSLSFYNVTDLISDSNYELTINTIDSNGNINFTNITDSNKTLETTSVPEIINSTFLQTIFIENENVVFSYVAFNYLNVTMSSINIWSVNGVEVFSENISNISNYQLITLNFGNENFSAGDNVSISINLLNIFGSDTLVTSTIISNFQCFYEDEPNVYVLKDNRAHWFCIVENSSSCYSYIEKNNRTIQVSPERQFIREYGEVDKFEVNNNLVQVYFDLENVIPNTDFIFGVRCGDDLFETTIVPIYNVDNTNRVIETTIWIGRNSGYLIFIGLFLLFAIVLYTAYLWWKK